MILLAIMLCIVLYGIYTGIQDRDRELILLGIFVAIILGGVIGIATSVFHHPHQNTSTHRLELVDSDEPFVVNEVDGKYIFRINDKIVTKYVSDVSVHFIDEDRAAYLNITRQPWAINSIGFEYSDFVESDLYIPSDAVKTVS